MQTKFKEARVILLPTKDTNTNIVKIHIDNAYVYVNNGNNFAWGHQHLYIVTKDVLNEGDWIYINGNIARASKINASKNGFGKVIASTDKSLGLPQPSVGFVKKYCQMNGSIDKVSVEYKQKGICYAEPCSNSCSTCELAKEFKYKIKVTKDNTITIKPIKNTFTREEVEQLVRDAFDLGTEKVFMKEIEEENKKTKFMKFDDRLKEITKIISIEEGYETAFDINQQVSKLRYGMVKLTQLLGNVIEELTKK